MRLEFLRRRRCEIPTSAAVSVLVELIGPVTKLRRWSAAGYRPLHTFARVRCAAAHPIGPRGAHDCADPAGRVGPLRRFLKPILSPEETAAHQIEQLGFRRDDVRHIVVTHLDLDHIGGLSDFPHAQVHVTAAEALGAIISPSRFEKTRYRCTQWAHKPNIMEHDPQGEKWRGFAAAKELDEISPG